ncbi:cobyrinate a,c-diamide synthase [Litoreibacter roseus]|uniref:Hydrogenobyrinate a,c-diamide synthase n=1 Tax=Litoreibacter roseus TaxID=2601869 RepID=A0A6N6JGB8_9RHOB|nr:cobyrinate a,c-diamide synthase [Litoreibacter roseus]GFE64262.1 cobyrinic acid a,c-diamide synthase [Litoreibacter roseus]
MSGRGLLIAAPSSGSGKTTITLGLLRALSRRGLVRGAKSGPDYIDPKFHEAACGRPCLNLDAWAMTPDRMRALSYGSETLIVEGAMGLFDGAGMSGSGSAADVARHLNLPVVLVVDCSRMAHSVAALVKGFMVHDPSLVITGVILNKVGSDKHAAMISAALADVVPVLGAVPRRTDLIHPSRHLGLVQAGERADLETWLEDVADLIETHVDLDALAPAPLSRGTATGLPPPAQSIAVAHDIAFAFAYPHILRDWRDAGAEVSFFSPLNDEPVPQCDLVYLPGGYPELHAGRIADNSNFLNSIRSAAEAVDIYGECGGYMILGKGLVDANGVRHQMAGLLNLETSFQAPKLHLGYRMLSASKGPIQGHYRGHEFHYATTVSAAGDPLFDAHDADGIALDPMGLRHGRVAGSFAHIIDRILPPSR